MANLWNVLTVTGYLLFILLLLLILIEDFRYRAVRWWFFPLLGLLAVAIEYKDFRLQDVLLNSCFTLIQLAMLSFYFSLKEKKMINITRKYLGWGDIVFWAVLCILFSPLNFVLFFMASMVFVSVVVISWKLTGIKPAMTTVPLAGLQSLAVLMVTTITLVTDVSFRNDAWLEKWLIA